MTSIEYKSGMVKALKDLSAEIGNDFWSNESYCKDGIPAREARLLYVSTCEMIIKRILEIEAEINHEIDEMSKQA